MALVNQAQQMLGRANVRYIKEGEDLELDEKQVPYQLVRNLGFGGHGFVEEVVDITTGACYARKTFRLNRIPLQHAKEMLYNEVKIIRELAPHPHIIRVHATYIAGRNLSIVLQPVADAGNLAQFLSHYKDLECDDTSKQTNARVLWRSIGCLSRCLAYLHSLEFSPRPIIRHKDIKPSNILMHDGYAIFTDFGISRRCTEDETTTDGRPELVTRRYCPPEVADHDYRNRKADVFSLGCVFLEVIAALIPGLLPDTFIASDSGPYYQQLDEIRALLSNQGPVLLAIKEMLRYDGASRPSAIDISKSIVDALAGETSAYCPQCSGFDLRVQLSPSIGKDIDAAASRGIRTSLRNHQRNLLISMLDLQREPGLPYAYVRIRILPIMMSVERVKDTYASSPLLTVLVCVLFLSTLITTWVILARLEGKDDLQGRLIVMLAISLLPLFVEFKGS